MRRIVTAGLVLALLATLSPRSGSTFGARLDHTVHCQVFVERPVPPDLGTRLPRGVKTRPCVVGFGLPLPAGADLRSLDNVVVIGAERYDIRPLEMRPDGSIGWIAVEALAESTLEESWRGLTLTTGARTKDESRLAVAGESGDIDVDNGRLRVKFNGGDGPLIGSVTLDGTHILHGSAIDGIRLRPGEPGAEPRHFALERLVLDDASSLRVRIEAQGAFVRDGTESIAATLRFVFDARAAWFRIEATIDAPAAVEQILEFAWAEIGQSVNAVSQSGRDWASLTTPDGRRALWLASPWIDAGPAPTFTSSNTGFVAAAPLARRIGPLPVEFEGAFAFTSADVQTAAETLILESLCPATARAVDPAWYNDSGEIGDVYIGDAVVNAFRAGLKLGPLRREPLRHDVADPREADPRREPTWTTLDLADDIAVDLAEWLRSTDRGGAPWQALARRRFEFDLKTPLRSDLSTLRRHLEGYILLSHLMVDPRPMERARRLAKSARISEGDLGYASGIAAAIDLATLTQRSGLEVEGLPPVADILAARLGLAGSTGRPGVDPARGCVLGEKEAKGPSSVVMIESQNDLAAALGRAMRLGRLDTKATRHALGVIEAVATFARHELWVDRSEAGGPRGFLRGARLDAPRPETPERSEFWDGGFPHAGHLLTEGYLATGEVSWRRIGEAWLEAAEKRPESEVRVDVDTTGRLAFLHVLRFARTYAVWRDLVLETSTGDGHDEIRLAVPQNGETLHLRRSSGNAVLSLREDYAAVATSDAPFFAAEIIETDSRIDLTKHDPGLWVKFEVPRASPSKDGNYRARYLETSPNIRDLRAQERRIAASKNAKAANGEAGTTGSPEGATRAPPDRPATSTDVPSSDSGLPTSIVLPIAAAIFIIVGVVLVRRRETRSRNAA